MFRSIIIGDAIRQEFLDAVDCVRKETDCRLFRTPDDFFATFDGKQESPVLDLILLLQSYGGEYLPTLPARIRKRYPITPLVTLLGIWCEGESRTGKPLPATHRLSCFCWNGIGTRELRALKNGTASRWNLPWTCTDEDVFLEAPVLFERNQPEQTGQTEQTESRLAGIVTAPGISRPDREMNRVLSQVLKTARFRVEDFSIHEIRTGKPDVVFWDVGKAASENILDTISRLKTELPNARLFLFLFAPEVSERESYHSRGADFVLSKPFEVSEILGLLGSETRRGT